MTALHCLVQPCSATLLIPIQGNTTTHQLHAQSLHHITSSRNNYLQFTLILYFVNCNKLNNNYIVVVCNKTKYKKNTTCSNHYTRKSFFFHHRYMIGCLSFDIHHLLSQTMVVSGNIHIS